jgi:hypothetical protein
LADRVRANILLCRPAFDVERNRPEAWRELMFAETDQAAKATHDPVAPAERSTSAQPKAASKLLDEGQPAHRSATLMAEMATLGFPMTEKPGQRSRFVISSAPRMITLRCRPSAVSSEMSVSGSPSTSRRSDRAPGSTQPISPCICIISAFIAVT